MSWTKEQFLKFCEKAGVNPGNALKEGKIDMRSPEIKEKHRQDRVKGVNKTNIARKRREAKERKDAISHFAAGIQNAKRESNQSMALEQAVCEQVKGLERASPSFRCKITGYRVRPIDQDNFIAGCKGIIDGIVIAQLLPRDDWKTTALEFEQVKVPDWNDELTMIEIDFPNNSAEPLT